MRPLALLVGVVFGAACSRGGSRPPAAAGTLIMTAPDAGGDGGLPIPTMTGPPRMIEGRYFVKEGAPDPLACRKDRDCIGDTVTDDTGCCVRSADTFPQTWAWHAWLTEERLSESCERSSCPPQPPGTMPLACKLDVRCVAQKCASSCPP